RALQLEQSIDLLRRRRHERLRGSAERVAAVDRTRRPSRDDDCGEDAAGVGRNTAVVPAITRRAPASIGNVTVSSRKRTPHIMPNAGRRNVTVMAGAAPRVAVERK